jgi:hypothetical protein
VLWSHRLRRSSAARTAAVLSRRIGHGRAGASILLLVLGTAGAVGAASPDPSAGATLPVRLVDGDCQAPGAVVAELADARDAGPTNDSRSTVHVSITDVPQAIDQLASPEHSLLVGGVDAASAVACGQLRDLEQDGQSVAVLSAQHDTGHVGAVILSSTSGGTRVEAVIVSPMAPDASPSAPAGSPPQAPDPSDAGLAPVRSPQPGTSGAPPFSPLPAG